MTVAGSVGFLSSSAQCYCFGGSLRMGWILKMRNEHHARMSLQKSNLPSNLMSILKVTPMPFVEFVRPLVRERAL